MGCLLCHCTHSQEITLAVTLDNIYILNDNLLGLQTISMMSEEGGNPNTANNFTEFKVVRKHSIFQNDDFMIPKNAEERKVSRKVSQCFSVINENSMPDLSANVKHRERHDTETKMKGIMSHEPIHCRKSCPCHTDKEYSGKHITIEQDVIEGNNHSQDINVMEDSSSGNHLIGMGKTLRRKVLLDLRRQFGRQVEHNHLVACLGKYSLFVCKCADCGT